jgi:hypothetical protein
VVANTRTLYSTHSLTHSPTHSLSPFQVLRTLSHLTTHSLSPPFPHSLTHSLTHHDLLLLIRPAPFLPNSASFRPVLFRRPPRLLLHHHEPTHTLLVHTRHHSIEEAYGPGRPTHSLTYSLTHSLTYSLTHSLTYSLTHPH